MITRQPIKTTGDLWCWMNTWGDLTERGLTGERADGYHDAMMDLLRVLRDLGIEASDEDWQRWSPSHRELETA